MSADLWFAYRRLKAIWKDHSIARRMAFVAVSYWAGERWG